ncbi:hypothetical protein PRZ48_010371 [Zasmidium cellare]|uniref:P-loop containing nucleoside triphosphate hydrolase protein n=1 Tax=Zasmidium cellare TaxID=395010 RepID=A0ABR0E8G5_ZASCE|nr:hypothetical protein PRZ48_010371 [Zasmidium cellare]
MELPLHPSESSANVPGKARGPAIDYFYHRTASAYHMGGHKLQAIRLRVSFSWVWPLLHQARTKGTLETDDLPKLDPATRSAELYERFTDRGLYAAKQRLWRVLAFDHHASLIRQWTVSFIESCFMMLPPLCLYKLLSLLESAPSNHVMNSEALFWIFGLVVAKMIHAGMEAWVNWVSFAICATPVRSQLATLIFAKLLKAKCGVDQTSLPHKTQKQDGSPKRTDLEEGSEADETDSLLPKSKDEDTDEEKAANGAVNLLAIDVQRISVFAGYNVDLLRGLVKIVLSSTFLIFILGWQSTLAGFLVPILLQPASSWAATHYTARQLSVMKARDEKAFIVSEVLQGIRQIKLTATEDFWEKAILKAREKEIRAQWSVFAWAIFLTVIWITMPVMIGATSLSVYALLGRNMVPSVAFTALSLFSSLEFTIGAIPNTITEMLDALVSINRIEQHLKSPEVENAVSPSDAVEFDNATIVWPSPSPNRNNSRFMLRNLTLRFPPGKLSVIHGSTAVGKSLLLAAIIGEADLLEGTIKKPTTQTAREQETYPPGEMLRPNTYAFVSQQPWIENASVRDTILYGLPYNRERYSETLHASALDQDLEILPDGDQTEIGPTGINLSGGQRWRLTFARALYSRASTLVLDDIFSAVDAHVGKHLLQHGIRGKLAAGRTIILVTHHVGLVEPDAEYMVNLDDRNIKTSEAAPASDVAGLPQISAPTQLPSQGDESVTAKEPAKTFVAAESRQEGSVKFRVYKTYFTASKGRVYWIVSLVFFVLTAVISVGRSIWLARWTDQYKEEATLELATSSHGLGFYLGIYIGLSAISIALVFSKIGVILLASLRAARYLFETAMQNVLRAPLRWLDTEPYGRILNRFVGDFALIDSKLGGDMMWCTEGIFSLVAIIAASFFVSAWMVDGARDIKRLKSVSKSPMFELVGSTVSGLSTIRAFGRADAYMDRMYSLIDTYAQASWHVLLASQWMRFRQGMLGALFALCIALGVVLFPTSASLAGLALSFALEYSSVVENTITRYSGVELDMNSTERVLEYKDLETEPQGGDAAPAGWPSQGNIQVQDLRAGYADDLPPILNGINFEVNPGERIGIVGRTGSGKSSLTLALFRFIHARTGFIKIDGIDTNDLKLQDLRSNLAIIPQDPFLFTGTIRSNLDPHGRWTDKALLDALKRVRLVPSLQDDSVSLSGMLGLQSPVTRTNLSQGQKQLLCLARAMISQPKILILDEATSAVDMTTDSLIQKSIREDFSGSTLLVVAHRLSTVADFDRILVMINGQVVEFDTPQALAEMPNGVFRGMMESSGESHALSSLLERQQR